MSNVDSQHQPMSLEEAVAEIDSLRSQLSGSDLKVFSQNRELKVENQKLKEEIRQLTEQCVSQTFKVRGLEKSEEKLQGELAQAGEKIQDLEAQVVELGGEIENYRSKEIHLSQELEKTIADNAQAVERMLSEHSQQMESRSAEYSKSVQELEDAMSQRDSAIKQLEDRVEQFKEEFLSQEITLKPVDSTPQSGQGKVAFDLLSRKMEDFLGFPGRALVEQVFRLSGVDPSSSSPSELEETFEVLQDTASQLVRNEEQEKELAALLKNAWQEIGLGEESAVPTPPTPEPETSAETDAPAEPEAPSAPETQESEPEPSIEEPAAEEAAVAEESVESSVEETKEEAAQPEPEISPSESVEEEGSVEEPEPTPEPEEEPAPTTELAEEPTENTPEAPETSEPDVPEAEPETEAREAETESTEEPEDTTEPEASEEPEASVEEVAPAPEPEAESVVDESSVEETAAEAEVAETSSEEKESSPEEPAVAASESSEDSAPAVQEEPPAEAAEPEVSETAPAAEPTADFETAATYLEEGRHAEALPIFETLSAQDASEPTYQVGRIACLVGLARFAEAHQAGKALEGTDLGESADVFQDSMEAALIGMVGQTKSDLVKKELILELLLRAEAEDDVLPYLDEADEIPMRISREGELSLLQATHRVGQDDVTEYLIDALGTLSDRPAAFQLLKTNLERYPELRPLSEFIERLLDSPRAETLEAESNVRDLLGQGETVEELLDEADPGEEAVVQVFLEHLIPRSSVEFEVPSESFEELMLDAEPAAFVGSLRQALRSVDYTLFFDEIEVLSYDGEEHFLLRSSPEPKPTLLFGADIDDVPPEELRFLVLRELFSMYRRHSQLKHISAGLDDAKRVQLVNACVDIYSEFEAKVPEDTVQKLDGLKAAATDGGQEPEFRSRLEAFLRDVYQETESDSFLELGDFLYGEQLNKKWLEPIADNFGAKQTGMVVASYAICRDLLDEDEFEAVEENGFAHLYKEENLGKHADLRLRLQRLWSAPLKALISEPEE